MMFLVPKVSRINNYGLRNALLKAQQQRQPRRCFVQMPRKFGGASTARQNRPVPFPTLSLKWQNKNTNTTHGRTFLFQLQNGSNFSTTTSNATRTAPAEALHHPSAEQTAAQAITHGRTPPLPVRATLVATATALGTPAFPVIGFVNFGLRYLVWDHATRSAILGATSILGACGTLVSIAAFDLMPVAYSYGQLFLPFALVNGSLAGTAYVVLDLGLGPAKVASSVFSGAAIGAFVGFMGPASGLYDQAFTWIYEMETDGWFSYLLSNGFMLLISVTTGAAAGLAFHPLLYYPIVGISGWHWTKFSAPILAGGTALLLHLYFSDYYDARIFPPETYLETDEKQFLHLVSRFHAQNLQVQDWGNSVGFQPSGTGLQARDSVSSKLEAAKLGNNTRTDKVFFSRRTAWLHYVTNGAFGDGYAIETIPVQTEINQESQKYISSDGAVAFLLHSNQHENVRERLIPLVNDLQTSRLRYKQDTQRAKRTVKRIEVASYGIALLLSSRLDNQNGDGKDAEDRRRERQLKKLERSIRQLVPGIILYESEEREGMKGASVEAQLQEFGWKSMEGKKDKQIHLQKWKAGFKEFESAELSSQLTWAITGLSMVVLFGLFSGGR